MLMVQHSGWGGVYHYSHRLSEALVERGHEVRLLTGQVAEFGRDRISYRLETIFNRWKTSPFRIAKSLAATPRPDVAHLHIATHAEFYWILDYAISNLARCPSIVTLHEIVAKDFEGWKTVFHKLVCRRSTKVIVHGNKNAEEASSALGIAGQKIAVLDHLGNFGIQTGPEDSKVARSEHPSVLFFGFIEPRKGVDDLIHAYAKVVARNPGCSLTIAGKPLMDMKPIFELCDRYGLRNRIRFDLRYLPSEAVARLFQESWLTVLPYTRATQSAVLFLAFGHGCPVISTNVGAIPEMLKSGVHGIVVPPSDPSALGDAILDLLGDPGRMSSLRENIRVDCERTFTWGDLGLKTEQVYSEAVRSAT
ncbi:glycosyltransferase family 4 protein [Acidobacteriota bacterium]